MLLRALCLIAAASAAAAAPCCDSSDDSCLATSFGDFDYGFYRECPALWNERSKCFRSGVCVAGDATDCCEFSFGGYVVSLISFAVFVWLIFVCSCDPRCGCCNGGCSGKPRYARNPATHCCYDPVASPPPPTPPCWPLTAAPT